MLLVQNPVNYEAVWRAYRKLVDLKETADTALFEEILSLAAKESKFMSQFDVEWFTARVRSRVRSLPEF